MASKPTKTSTVEAPATAPGPKRTRPLSLNPNGRPTVRTAENRAALIQAIEEVGLCNTSAAEYVGICYDTFRVWMQEDADFSADISRARAKFKRHHMDLIANAARKDARHSEWLLTHLFPGEFAERQIIDTNQTSPLDRFFSAPREALDPERTPDASQDS